MKKIALVLTITLGACGSDDRYGDPIYTGSDDAAASGAVEAALGLQSLASDPDGAGADGLSASYGSMFDLLAFKMGADQGGYAVLQRALANGTSEPWVLDRLREMPPQAFDETCVTQTETMVTFDQCTWEGITIDGTVSVTGATFAADLTVTAEDGEGNSARIEFYGSVTVTPASIVGDLTLAVDASGGGATVEAEITATYDVALTDGCATGGYLEVHGEGQASSPSGDASFDAWVKAVFGPACGQVTIY